jgi:endoribonuclease Dicer
VLLFSKGLLDYHLFPLPSNITARIGSAMNVMAEKESLSSLEPQYYPRKKPDFWLNTMSVGIQPLYPTVISTNHADQASRPHAPILILTRQPLPALPSFKLFFSGVPAVVRFTRGTAFKVEESRLHDIYMYTIRLCRAIANKPFVCPLADMPYFYAPLGLAWNDIPNTQGNQWEPPNVVDHIPWSLVSLAARTGLVELRTENLETITSDIEDAVIQDRWVEFTRRYDAVRMRPDLTPLSKPVDSPVRIVMNYSVPP